MKLKKLSLNIFISSIILGILFKSRISVCQPRDDAQALQTKSLGTEKFAYGHNITHQLVGSQIITQFTPKNAQGESIELQQLASSLGYDHFNWASYVVEDPYGIFDQGGQRLDTPYNDPPKGGYLYDAADHFPFYWDLEQCHQCKSRHHWQNEQNLKPFELVFEDAPADYRLQPGETIEFVTNLVGVKYYDPQNQTAKWEILHTFRWQLSNPQPNISKVFLVETEVDLNGLPTSLLSRMQHDGAELIID
ncbi:MAG: hypothetical protein RLZZ04_2258 [Cyanobacteriota bacterium]